MGVPGQGSSMRKQPGKSFEEWPEAAPLVRGPRNNKGKGELAELAFLCKASSLGFGVAKPYGDNEPYDFILDSGERFWRVQVRSTSSAEPGRSGYVVASRRGHAPNFKQYQAKEIDFFVVYVVPLGVWYVVPVNQIGGLHHLRLYPSGCRGGGCFEEYREAWGLMAPGADLPGPRKLRRERTDLHRKGFVE
jgi:hypothetical protein